MLTPSSRRRVIMSRPSPLPASAAVSVNSSVSRCVASPWRASSAESRRVKPLSASRRAERFTAMSNSMPRLLIWAAADFDAEGDGEVHRQAGNSGGVAEQRIERFEMVSDRLALVFKPAKDSGVALVQNPLRRTDLQSRHDLFNQLTLAVWGQRRED